ncbi:hypothetical protein ACHAW6_000537 [Cyclotella cf. meneghiniana]
MPEDYPYGYEICESLGVERSIINNHDGNISTRKVEKQSSLSPDSKETFSIGPMNSIKSGMPSRRFPKGAPPSFEEALTQYYSTMEQLTCTLFRGLALALELEEEYFLQEGFFDDGHQCALRILNYPELLNYEDDDDKVRIQAGAHTDYGAMTILNSGGPGLQLCFDPEGNNSDK